MKTLNDPRFVSRLLVVLVLGWGAGWLVPNDLAAEEVGASADDTTKIVLIAGPITGHGKNTHEYEKSVVLLRHMLERAKGLGELVVESHFGGWPKDPTTLQDADTIMLITDGGDHRLESHPLYVGERRSQLARELERGCGLIQFHWSTFHPRSADEETLRWLGGYFDYESGDGPNHWYSAIQTWEAQSELPNPEHPIARGVRPFRTTEEYYYRMRFRLSDSRVTPIVQTTPPGESQGFTVGWAVEREDGGRSFGFTGGHFYRNWWNDDFRKLILNAIVWTAGQEVPLGGVVSEIPGPLRGLIVTGYHSPHHDWRAVTAALIPAIEQDPRLIMDVSEDVEVLGRDELNTYDFVVFNYCNWDRGGLSESARRGLLRYLRQGKGFSIIHFANGAFTDTLPNAEGDWPEFRERIVRRIWVHGDGGSSHDPFGRFTAMPTDVEHPISVGLEAFETDDELYFDQVGELPITPLVVAKSKVTGRDEPLAWAYDYETSRVFQTVLGHSDVSIRRAGALIRRGVTWTAGLEPLGFDPPVSLNESYLWRAGASWTPEESFKRAEEARSKAEGSVKAKRLPEADAARVAGREGGALDARVAGGWSEGVLEVGAPLTIEAWVRLERADGFNIIVASEPKSSASHWELYTYAQTGELAFYIPGASPAEIRSGHGVVDGEWHHVSATYAKDQVELWVDGKSVHRESLERAVVADRGVRLAIGRLVEGGIGCAGWIDGVHLRRGIQRVDASGEVATRDKGTVGLWNFNEWPSPQGTVGEDVGAVGLVVSREVVSIEGVGGDQPTGDKPASGEPDGQGGDESQKPEKLKGHWGEDAIGFRWTEEDSVDGRWQATDKGPFLGTSMAIGEERILKGLVIGGFSEEAIESGSTNVCEAAVIYDTISMSPRAAWTGDLVRTHPPRFGLIQHPSPGGPLFWRAVGERVWGDTKVEYQSLAQHGVEVLLTYRVDGVSVQESPRLMRISDSTVLLRTLRIGAHRQELPLPIDGLGEEGEFQSGPEGWRWRRAADGSVVAWRVGRHQTAGALVAAAEGELLASDESVELQVAHLRFDEGVDLGADAWLEELDWVDLDRLSRPGKTLWGETLTTAGELGAEKKELRFDTIELPFENPYRALMFLSGIDFFANGDAAISTVHGDVWRVGGLQGDLSQVTWRRIATGLFQPLGLKILDDTIYVLGKDRITHLVDRDGDGEIDLYASFNQAGETSFGNHDYATCLETDAAGNFYYARGNTGIERVSADGSEHEVIATGLRNPNGMGISAGGLLTASPQEGEWTPASNIAVIKPGRHFGYLGPQVTDGRPLGYDPPMLWLPRLVDNSSGGQVWLPREGWGRLNGAMIHLSFGRCWPLLVLPENVDGVWQAGTVKLPFSSRSGLCRGRVQPTTADLYLIGIKGWASASIDDGSLHRIVPLSQEISYPVEQRTLSNGIELSFGVELDRDSVQDTANWAIQQWNYRYSAEYGSADYKVSKPGQQGHDLVDVRSVTLAEDGRTVFIEIPEIGPVMQMAINYQIAASDQSPVQQTLYATIHRLGKEAGKPGPHAERAAALAAEKPSLDALSSGLILRLSQTGIDGEVVVDSRVSRNVVLHLDGGDVSPWIESRALQARFEGWLVQEQRQQVDFRVLVPGTVSLRVEGDEVAAETRGNVTGWSDVSLTKGLNRFELVWDTVEEPVEGIALEWRGASFGWEPVPASLWRHSSEDRRLQKDGERRFLRERFAQLQCHRCHQVSDGVMPELQFESPDLIDVGDRYQPGWLYQWILQPREMSAETSMPHLFDAENPRHRATVANLVAYLTAGSEAAGSKAAENHVDDQGGVGETDDGLGLVLMEEVGCVACHRVDDEPLVAEGRRSLEHVGDKYYAESLGRFLREPTAHHGATRMPSFDLSEDEVELLSGYLMGLAGEADFEVPVGDAGQGAIDFQVYGCASCHRVDAGRPLAGASVALIPADHGCLAPVPMSHTGAGFVPDYGFSEEERAAWVEWLELERGSLQRESRVEVAERWIRRLNCVGCHDRDGRSADLAEILYEESTQGLGFERLPDLTRVSDKLRHEWLSVFLADSAHENHRPWLRARMPAFPQYASGIAEGLRMQAVELERSSRDLASSVDAAELVEMGRVLIGQAKGFDCRQCHALGEAPATGDEKSQVALGINFAAVPDRLRRDYFDRWMLDPLRIDPLTKMPKYSEDGARTKIDSVLEGDALRQFDAIWRYLASEAEEDGDESSGVDE